MWDKRINKLAKRFGDPGFRKKRWFEENKEAGAGTTCHDRFGFVP